MAYLVTFVCTKTITMHDILNVILLITIETAIVLGSLAALATIAWASARFVFSRK